MGEIRVDCKDGVKEERRDKRDVRLDGVVVEPFFVVQSVTSVFLIAAKFFPDRSSLIIALCVR